MQVCIFFVRKKTSYMKAKGMGLWCGDLHLLEGRGLKRARSQINKERQEEGKPEEKKYL